MPIYQIQIADGVVVQQEADSPQEAAALVKTKIATKAAGQYYDQLAFDYETGVPNVQGLRSLLGRMETREEQDVLLTSKVGSNGFTRDSKDNLALTHSGLDKLGLADLKQYQQLSDGTQLPKNIVIDERSFDASGDLADLSGIVGPIAGAITFLSPAARVGNIAKLILGNPRAQRVLQSAIGSATGKGAEELADANAGLQLQNQKEVTELLTGEFFLGGIAQGVGELLGVGFNLLLGKQKPFDDIRLYRQGTLGRSGVDIQALDRRLGREATEKEIRRAIKNGEVSILSGKAIPSQSALNRKLVGRGQAVAEQVFGNKRQIQTTRFLFDELNNLKKKINLETETFDEYISEAVKGSLDESLDATLRTLRAQEADVTQSLVKLLDETAENITDMGLASGAPAKSTIHKQIGETLQEAYTSIQEQFEKKYVGIDELLNNISNDPAVNRKIQNALGKTLKPYLQNMKRHIEKAKKRDKFLKKGIVPDDDAPVQFINAIPKVADEFLKEIDQGTLNLGTVRSTLSTLRLKNSLPENKGLANNAAHKAEKELVDFFKAIEDPNILLKESPDLPTEVVVDFTKQIKNLRKINQEYRARISPFNQTKVKQIKDQAKIGSFDPDEIYDKFIIDGTKGDLSALFQATKDYDKYLINIKGQSGDRTQFIKNSIAQRLFKDAALEAEDPVTGIFDFHVFSKEILNFERKFPGKLDLIFTNQAGSNSATLLRETLEQINRLKPNLKPREMKNLIDDINKSETGLVKTEPGKEFIEKLSALSQASEELAKREQNALFRDLPNRTVEETTDIIFRPNSASNIKILKDTVSPEVFGQIQNASMTKLLKNSVDFNGKGNIVDIFKPGNLKSALDSYGDETLNEMFGTQVARGLRDFQKSIDIFTAGEVGTGGAAGTLIAAGIAVNAFNLAMLPTVAGLAVFREVMSNPLIVGNLAKTDKGSVMKVLDAFAVAIRNATAQGIAEGSGGLFEGVSDQVDNIIQSEETQEAAAQLKEILDANKSDIINTQNEIRRAISPPTVSIELPDVNPVQQTEISPERLALAEALSGRSII
jgi:hypothetical protein